MSETIRPLSVGQQSLWLLYRLAPDSAAYNVADAVLVTPAPDLDLLDRAVTALQERHDLLRSRFVEVGGEAAREVRPAPLCTVDVRHVPDADDAQVLELAGSAGAEPFELTRTGPLRVVLLHRGRDAVLVVVAHHIASDGLSQRLIWRDLAAAYTAFAAGADPDWPPLTASYHDYVTRERQLLASPRGAELAGYWRQASSGAQAATLPTDHPRPARSAYRGASRSQPVPDDLVRRVRDTAAAAGVTPFTVLLAAFQALLHRYSGQADLTIGCPMTTRRTRALRDMVGLLVNTVLLRATVTPETTLAELTAAARAQLTAGTAGVGYPFALLNAARASNDPLYRIAITMVRPQFGDRLPDNVDGRVELFAGHTVVKLDVPRMEGQADLTVEITQLATSMEIVFRYDTELFDPATVDRLLAHYLRMITVTCTDPAARVSRVALVDPAERRRLLALGGVGSAGAHSPGAGRIEEI